MHIEWPFLQWIVWIHSLLNLKRENGRGGTYWITDNDRQDQVHLQLFPLVSQYSNIKHNLIICRLLLFIIIVKEKRTLWMVCQVYLPLDNLVFTMSILYPNVLYLKYQIFQIVLYYPTCLSSIWMNHKSHYSRFINISKLNKVFSENF